MTREPCAACGAPARPVRFDTIRGPEYLCDAHARDQAYRFPRDAPAEQVEARRRYLERVREDLRELRREVAVREEGPESLGHPIDERGDCALPNCYRHERSAPCPHHGGGPETAVRAGRFAPHQRFAGWGLDRFGTIPLYEPCPGSGRLAPPRSDPVRVTVEHNLVIVARGEHGAVTARCTCPAAWILTWSYDDVVKRGLTSWDETLRALIEEHARHARGRTTLQTAAASVTGTDYYG